ncbi:MAG: hypothetical protein IPM69_14930 [Ignavibacteria bacterium]|nr:hypothetical protein [Ignavibacteria bacterium]
MSESTLSFEKMQEHRQLHLERRLSDENEAIERIEALGKLYKCELMPQTNDEGQFTGIIAATREPDNDLTRKNLELFTKYLIETKEHYMIEFFPVYHENSDGKLVLSQILPMVTW